jgi:hypothetical protein
MTSLVKPLKTCSHSDFRWDGAKKNSFSQLLLQAPKNMLSQGSRFAKQFTKTDSAPLIELFVELKQKKGFTSEVKPCQTGPKSISKSFQNPLPILIFFTRLKKNCSSTTPKLTSQSFLTRENRPDCAEM